MQRHVPFGYQIQNGKAVIEPKTADFVREIFSTYLEGISTYRIAKDFTQRGILKRPLGTTDLSERFWKIINIWEMSSTLP